MASFGGFNQFNQMSLSTLMAVQAENPDKVSTNLALSRTYLQRGLSAKAVFHLQRAHALAKQRYEQDPNSANNAYWLAMTYKELGDRKSAAQYYQRAFELEPSTTKYRKAYYAMMPSKTAADEQETDTE